MTPDQELLAANRKALLDKAADVDRLNTYATELECKIKVLEARIASMKGGSWLKRDEKSSSSSPENSKQKDVDLYKSSILFNPQYLMDSKVPVRLIISDKILKDLTYENFREYLIHPTNLVKITVTVSQ